MTEANLIQLATTLLVLLFSLTVHETAHAWTANQLGDSTARRLGRISLNPVVHIDPIGTVVLPVMGYLGGGFIFGWAKPVPVNTMNLGNPRRDFLLVAAAGPASNLVLAGCASAVLRSGIVSFGDPLFAVATLSLHLNVLLAVFNMIPVPPLDGGNVLGSLLPGPVAGGYDRIVRPYGFLILLALMVSGMLGQFIGPPYFFLSGLLSP